MKNVTNLITDFLHRTGDICNYINDHIKSLDHYYKPVPIEEDIIRKEINESIVLYEKSTKIIDFELFEEHINNQLTIIESVYNDIKNDIKEYNKNGTALKTDTERIIQKSNILIKELPIYRMIDDLNDYLKKTLK